LIQVDEISKRPLVLLGQMWQDTLKAFVKSAYIYEDHRALIEVVLTPEEAVERIVNW
jgi:hypothetical protein